MKRILLVESSPRRGGNSEVIADTLAAALSGEDARVFKMRERDCRPCRACAACQGKDAPSCVQKDDITALLPVIDACDALVLAAPIYNHQIHSQAKLFIERFYPFFRVDLPLMSNTSKRGKKAALLCSCWGGPLEVYERYAAWTAEGFSQIGAEHTRALVFHGIPAPGDILKRPDYMDKLRELAEWLKAD